MFVFVVLSVLTEDQHHTLKSLVGPVEEFLVVITLFSFISFLPLLKGGGYVLPLSVCLPVSNYSKYC